MSDLAAWVQAGGTLVALALTVWVAHDAKQTDARNRRNDYRRLLESVDNAGAWALSMLEALGREMPFSSDVATRTQFSSAYKPTAFDAALRALREIPFYQLGDAELAQSVLDLEHKLTSLKAELDAFQDRLDTPSGMGALPSHGTGLMNALRDRIAVEAPARRLSLRAQQLLNRAATPRHLITPISDTNPLAGAKS